MKNRRPKNYSEITMAYWGGEYDSAMRRLNESIRWKKYRTK